MRTFGKKFFLSNVMKKYLKADFCKFVSISLIILFSSIENMAQDLVLSGLSTDDNRQLTMVIKNGLIEKIKKGPVKETAGEKIYIAPGFIDTQINGYASISFNEEGLTAEKIHEITRVLWKEGVTTFFPTIITNPPDLVRNNLTMLHQVIVADPELDHTMPGFFLEGPYISREDGFRGVHQKAWVRPPDWNEFMSFYQAAGGRIIQIGLAPEKEGAIDFIKQCVAKGVMVSLAHHNGDAATIEKAVQAGARVSTHLGNGCANMINRHQNPLWPQLANDQLTPSIIGDGHHLTREELTVFYKVKGPDNLMLVSDATELSGMPPGSYQWNGKTVVMTDDGMLIDPGQNVLAGASFPISKGVYNMVHLAGCSLSDAVKMATATPAWVYHLDDRGSLREGLAADLVLFSIEDGKIVIRKTIVMGKEVYSKDI